MSWQRILEMARRQGMPVIVTDIAGREPMVIMPFEAYEMLSEAGATAPRVRGAVRKIPVSSEPSRQEIALGEIAQAPLETSLPADELRQAGDGLSLEERFYLEPVDEGEVG